MSHVDLGPLAREDLWITAQDQVEDALRKGARAIYRREVSSLGYFMSPMILTNIDPSMRLWREECFAPVAVVHEFDHFAEAVEHANKNSYGLGASIFTSQETLAKNALIHDVDCGIGFVNEFVRSTPELSFGGIKHSGYGKELGNLGLFEFSNVRSIVQG